MRWVRFNRTAEPPSLARLGIVLNGVSVGDLRAGYASMLHAQGDQHARDIAALRIPRAIAALLALGAGGARVVTDVALHTKRLTREEAARRLTTIPGIGVLKATALIAAIGRGESFARGRDLAAWLGLVPRQLTTGGKPRLVGISKRGNKYLRKLLIHGARAALPTLLESPTSLGAWLRGLLARMHKNAAVVALANKLARMAWAVIRQGKTFNIAGSALA